MFLTMSKTGKYTNIFSIGQPLNYFYSIKQTKNLKDHQNNIQATGYTHTHTHIQFEKQQLKKADKYHNETLIHSICHGILTYSTSWVK